VLRRPYKSIYHFNEENIDYSTSLFDMLEMDNLLTTLSTIDGTDEFTKLVSNSVEKLNQITTFNIPAIFDEDNTVTQMWHLTMQEINAEAHRIHGNTVCHLWCVFSLLACAVLFVRYGVICLLLTSDALIRAFVGFF